MSKGFHQSAGCRVKIFRKPDLVALLLMTILLAGCSNIDLPKADPVKEEAKRETIFGDSGISLFNGDKSKNSAPGSSIGVNVFLWRATLDTLSVWPINSADPFGGVILTDWYSTPQAPNERFKMNVYILDRALRADGVRVSVFRQVRDTRNNWEDQIVQKGTARKIEDAILMRARQFRRNVTK